MNDMNSIFSRSRFERWLRLLTFRATADDYDSLAPKDFILGLLATWLVGMGRYWDDSRASLLQHLGLGSVIYIFVLGFLLWLIAKPVSPRTFSYFKLLTFISLTAPPAAFYAIPVELWMSLESANQMNLVFLGIVAVWRVSLYFHYLRKAGRLDWTRTFVCAAMPLAVILSVLVYLNLHHVVMNIMGGIREADQTSQDAAYEVMFLLAGLSFPLSLVCALIWIYMVTCNLRQWRSQRPQGR